LSEEVTQDIPQLSEIERDILTSPFIEEEVFEAISSMEHNKAPKPDGFSADFYQTFWPIIKEDLMDMFIQLKDRDLPLYKLNFGVITLLPKK
jgi:hypothetical protein